jgi:hypothetical protein
MHDNAIGDRSCPVLGTIRFFTWVGSFSLPHILATVHHNFLPIDKTSFIGEQHNHGVCDVFRGPNPLERDRLFSCNESFK